MKTYLWFGQEYRLMEPDEIVTKWDMVADYPAETDNHWTRAQMSVGMTVRESQNTWQRLVWLRQTGLIGAMLEARSGGNDL